MGMVTDLSVFFVGGRCALSRSWSWLSGRCHVRQPSSQERPDYRKPKKQRRLSFSEIAQHCRVLRLQIKFAGFQGDCRCAQMFGLEHLGHL